MTRRGLDPSSAIRWLEVANGSGEVIPAYGVMRITGYADGAITVAKPNADDMDPAVLIVNSHVEIAVGENGFGTQDGPMLAAYTGGTPAFNDKAGTTSGAWTLTKDKTGFLALGTGSGGYVLVTNRYRPLVNVICDGGDIEGDYTN